MIGNDVIDLAQSRKESNWQRKGFIEKLFTTDEQRLIRNYTDPETLLWLLWSMKEAAYKIYNRQTKIREFCPKKLVCLIESLDINNSCGKVVCDKNIYYTKTIFSLESIHTVAVTDFKNIENIIEVENKEIVKDENGIPYLKISSNKLQDISISHHGRFERRVILKN